MQVLWVLGFDWDESFEKNEELVAKWMAIVSDTHEVAKCKLRRQIVVEPETEIHVFWRRKL